LIDNPLSLNSLHGSENKDVFVHQLRKNEMGDLAKALVQSYAD